MRQIALGLLLSLLWSPSMVARDWSRVWAGVVGRVMTLRMDIPGVDPYATCSAWPWAPGVLITAAHCVQAQTGEPYDNIRALVDPEDHEVELSIIYSNPLIDFALVRGEELDRMEPLPRVAEQPSIGAEVLTIGWPHGLYLGSRQGIVAGQWTYLWLIDTLGVYGMSGGVALTANGEAFGLLVQASESDDMILVLPTSIIELHLKEGVQ